MRVAALVLGLLASVVAANAADGSRARSAPTGSAARAQLDYMLNCQGCHLGDGSGSPGRVPDLRLTLGALLGVPGGREFVQRVPGAATAALDDARLADVLNWMLAQFDTASAAEPFTAAETGRLRRSPLTDVAAARAPLAAQAGLPIAY